MMNLTIDKLDEDIRLDKVIDIIEQVKKQEEQKFQVERIEKTNGDTLIKVYEDGVLVAVEENNGEMIQLASVPEFDSIKVNLELGKIWIESQNRWSLATKANRQGYVYSTFTNNAGEKIPTSIHAIVKSSKLNRPISNWLSEGLTVDHVDSNPENNAADNLRLLTMKEQLSTPAVREKMENRQARRVNNDQVREVKYVATKLKLMNTYKLNEVAKFYANKFKVDYITIYNILSGNTYGNVELDFEQKLEIEYLIAEQKADEIQEDIETLIELSA